MNATHGSRAWVIAAGLVSSLIAASVGATTKPVARGSTLPALTASGASGSATPVRVLLVPAQETTIAAPTTARIERIHGELGMPFKQGAPLISFECGEQRAKMRMAFAEHDSARLQLEAKQRLKSLDAAGDSEVQLAVSSLARATAQIDLARTQAQQCRIDAPFPGRVVRLHARGYQGVTAGQPLLEIVSSGPLKIRLNAPSKWLNWLREGASFQVKIDETGQVYPAVVSAVNGRIDAVSQSIEIEGTIHGAFPELLAGMSGHFVTSNTQ